jgi:hypothetical protein
MDGIEKEVFINRKDLTLNRLKVLILEAFNYVSLEEMGKHQVRTSQLGVISVCNN